jgi:hypothetical protein
MESGTGKIGNLVLGEDEPILLYLRDTFDLK